MPSFLFVCFLICFVFFSGNWRANIIVELMLKQIMVNMKHVGITLHAKYKAYSKMVSCLVTLDMILSFPVHISFKK